MSPAGFKPTIPASERPQTHAFRPRGHWDWQGLKLLKANHQTNSTNSVIHIFFLIVNEMLRCTSALRNEIWNTEFRIDWTEIPTATLHWHLHIAVTGRDTNVTFATKHIYNFWSAITQNMHKSLLHSPIHISRQRHFPALMWNEVTTFGCYDNQAPRLEPYWICSTVYLFFLLQADYPPGVQFFHHSQHIRRHTHTHTSTIFQWRSSILFPSAMQNWW